jgi:Hg(II)-responsive transcriptional regulator
MMAEKDVRVAKVVCMGLRIGQLASAASVNVQTVRYYERRGLLGTKRRTPAGYRDYDPDAITRIRFIKHAQALGFSLSEIEDLLALRVRHGAACAAVEQRTREKIAVVDRKIRELRHLKDSLERLATSCESRTSTAECPMLESLEQENDVASSPEDA